MTADKKQVLIQPEYNNTVLMTKCKNLSGCRLSGSTWFANAHAQRRCTNSCYE